MKTEKEEISEPLLVNSRGAQALYCDDARLEASGKITLVGCYGDVLLVDSFPTYLPQLCIHLSVWTPNDQLFRTLLYRVYHDANIVHEDFVEMSEINESRVENPGIAREEAKGAVARFYARRIFRFTPFLIESPGALRVRVQTEQEVLPAGGLLLQARPKAEAASGS